MPAVKTAKTSSGPTPRRATPKNASDGAAPGRPDDDTMKAPGPNPAPAKKMSDLTPKERKLAEAVAIPYAMVGTGLTAIFGGPDPENPLIDARNPALCGVGRAAGNLSEKIAVQWVILSRTNEAVRKWLERIQSAASEGGIITIHLLLAAPLLAMSGAVPAPAAPMAAVMAGVAMGDIDESVLGL